jgi:hypothetical protein
MGGRGCVDDLISFWLLFVWHGNYSGLASACAHCLANADVAQRRERYVDELMNEIHFERSGKEVQVGQLGIFLGVWIDSQSLTKGD